jgi:protein-tyrosine phosphatase
VTATRTSASHPIRVDWLSPLASGALGLTFAPGKHSRSVSEDVIWARDLGADLERLRTVERVDVLVCLVEDHELVAMQIPDLVPRAEALGFAVLRLPIRDVDVPSSPEKLRAVLAQIQAATAADQRVVVHCAGGLGRSGVVAGCCLREMGHGGPEALAMLRGARGPRCPETRAQAAYVERWEVEGAASSSQSSPP